MIKSMVIQNQVEVNYNWCLLSYSASVKVFFCLREHQPLEVYLHYIFRQASFQKDTFFRLEVYERVKISRIEVFK